MISVLLENPRIFAAVVAFSLAFGACVGSFLNVVIYRLPRDISVGKPKRFVLPVVPIPDSLVL
ncbi:MAG: prepilin peptidase [Verrucomicrobiales bacterium]